MFAIPAVQYAEGHGGLIAYETFGEGPVDLVYIGAWFQTVEGIWDLPSAERFFRRLASFARVVLIDRRGFGLSDPLRSMHPGDDFGLWIEEGVSDVVTVLDAIGSERAAFVAEGIGATVGIVLAATHPDRVAGLVLVDPVVRLLGADDYPWGISVGTRERFAESARAGWGDGVLSGVTPSWRGAGPVPSLAHDPEAHRWLARWERASHSRGQAYAWWRSMDFDVRSLLPSIRAPTLILHHPSNVLGSPTAAMDYLVAAIAGAGYAPVGAVRPYSVPSGPLVTSTCSILNTSRDTVPTSRTPSTKMLLEVSKPRM